MLEYLITTYGYPALVLGAMIEGEAALVIAGFAAYLGYMSLPLVIVLGIAGSLLSDQIYFYIGRKKGKELIEKWPNLKKRMAWAHRLINKYSDWVLLFFRFGYGFRAIVPITIGTSDVSAKKFTIFNTLGAVIWSALFSIGGYFFGTTLSLFLEDIKKYELQAIVAIVAVVFVIWIMVSIKKKSILKDLEIDGNMII